MKLGITMLIHNKDDIEFVTEFPCYLGHPVSKGSPYIPEYRCLPNGRVQYLYAIEHVVENIA